MHTVYFLFELAALPNYVGVNILVHLLIQKVNNQPGNVPGGIVTETNNMAWMGCS